MPSPNLNFIANAYGPSSNFNDIRIAFIREIQKVTGLDSQHVVTEEPETQNEPRPSKPYMSMKITTAAAKNGDDSVDNVLDNSGNSTTVWNSGGQRKMTVEFNSYGTSHEEAYNYMTLWQTALDNEGIQSDLRKAGIAVWVIGNVADLSKLLNTGFEGRAHLETTFGIAVNFATDLGEMDSVTVEGTVSAGTSTIDTDETIP